MKQNFPSFRSSADRPKEFITPTRLCDIDTYDDWVTRCKKTSYEAPNDWSLLICIHCKKHGHGAKNCFGLASYS